jgi:hypothetical protein
VVLRLLLLHFVHSKARTGSELSVTSR